MHKRTKEQKIKAQQKRGLTAEVITQSSTQNSVTQKETSRPATFSYVVGPKLPRKEQETEEGNAEKYIKKDLLHTLLISLVLFGILVGIYFYLRYN
ncbi:hypothetical protein KA082_00115 [Candidatus Woesebacteria bacterium]|nr:hypothetical protein [Candidatus Woesebacteria bacterium]